jgi:hypothetical protein
MSVQQLIDYTNLISFLIFHVMGWLFPKLMNNWLEIAVGKLVAGIVICAKWSIDEENVSVVLSLGKLLVAFGIFLALCLSDSIRYKQTMNIW